MTIEKRISKARADLLLDFPWFGALAMHLAIVPEESIDTFDVDGTTMRYNPKFAETLTNKELQGVIAHEVMHCAFLHMFRREHRDHMLWNVACDYAINGEILKTLDRNGIPMTLPKGCLHDKKYDGLASETIYAQLQKEGKGKGKQSPQPTGTVLDAPKGQSDGDSQSQQGQAGQSQQKTPVTSQPQTMTEDDWKIAAEQANKVAQKAGNMPGHVARALGKLREAKVNWRQELREFLAATVPSDYSWQNPNRRFIHLGVYLPGVVKENFGHLAIAIDTSGSITQEMLDTFASEVNTIASELKPERVTVIYCDARVNHVDTFESEDVTFKMHGGGGTQFSPVFDLVNDWEERPVALLYFTDLACYDKPTEPGYPCLWVTQECVTLDGPFGRTIRITE
jgi:predicted metal-dependent peptidase